MARPGTWLVAGATSIVAHAVAMAVLVVTLQPRPIPQQPPPPAEIELAAETVRQSRATEAEAESRPAPGSAAAATPLRQDAPPRTTARAQTIEAVSTSATPPPSVTAPPAAADATAMEARAAEGTTIAESPPESRRAAEAEQPAPRTAEAVAADANSTVEIAARPEPLEVLAYEAAPVVSTAAKGSTLTAAGAEPMARPALSAAAQQLRAELPPETRIAAPVLAAPKIVRTSLAPSAAATAMPPPAGRRPVPARLDAPVGKQLRPAAQPLTSTPSSEAASQLTAALAWAVGESNVADPVSLAAIQAFMQPEDPAAAGSPVRDGLEALFAGVPCARLQTEFDPDTGMLELRGHVPEDALRGPLLAALQGQIGADIPVADRLLILPRPQCGALAGISAVGLPQSDDQRTNPRIVGESAFVREFGYVEGDRLRLDLTAPDYNAYVYIDYFDADGNVLHLQPNEIVPLERASAEAALTSGVERDGKPALNLTIGPPFGQEIAAAFAASEPLYDEVRPLIEPAEPYLEFLKERVAEARETHPDFKGEWVYFFISTAPAN